VSEILQRRVRHGHAGAEFESVLAHAGAGAERPGVIVFPTVMGVSDLEIGFAERLAGLGYAAFVADLYGRDKQGLPREEARAEMDRLRGNRPRLQDRLRAVLDAARGLPEVDPARVAAIGYCFGGLCVLDLARIGADLKGVASFHGIFEPPGNLGATPIRAKVVAFHGWDDPYAPPASVAALAAELSAAGADWQIHAYGHTGHGFTNPQANAPERGLAYDAAADRRSWAALEDFLAECFA
jgi:dienelactone hydrolase